MSTIKKIQVDGVDYDIKASEVEGITVEERCHLDIPWGDNAPVMFTMDDAPHHDIKIDKSVSIGTAAQIGQYVKIQEGIELTWSEDSVLRIGTGGESIISIPAGFDGATGTSNNDLIIDMEELDDENGRLYINNYAGALILGSSPIPINPLIIIGTGVRIGTEVKIGQDVVIGNDITIGSGTEIGKDVTISTSAVMTLSWGDENLPYGLYKNSPSEGMSMIITHDIFDSYQSGNSIVIHKGSEIHSMGDNPLKIKPYETGLVFECGNKKVTLPWETN